MKARTWRAVAAVTAGLMAVVLAGCGDDGATGGDRDRFTVGLLLPNRGIPRFEQSDRPLIEKRVKELCPGCTVEYANAGDDVANQRQQMDSMITKGAKVLILDAADPKALRSSVQAARRAGIPVVAYDRLAEGPLSAFVTFDGAQVGRLQGEALLKAMGDRGTEGGQIVMLNGDPSSPNAAWYTKGTLSVIKGQVKIGKSYSILGWRADNAHASMDSAIAALGPDRIDGVLAVNDAIASGTIAALKATGVSPLPPVTGQDADLDAVRRIVRGDQYMTVYKPFKTEADAAAAMAVALGRGEGLGAIAETTIDSPTNNDIPGVLLTPVAVTVGGIKRTLVKDGVYTVRQICTPQLRHECDRAGLTR